MSKDEKAAAREREARIAQLAKELFIHCECVADAQAAFRQAEAFDDLAQERWKEMCK